FPLSAVLSPTGSCVLFKVFSFSALAVDFVSGSDNFSSFLTLKVRDNFRALELCFSLFVLSVDFFCASFDFFKDFKDKGGVLTSEVL
uniref:Uncharacterized protein n=1 Tax=Ciona intestinalis TaxID=7719 RepID=H2Y1D6_CIOIN